MNYDDLVLKLEQQSNEHFYAGYAGYDVTMREAAAAIKELQKDAMRYRWLRDVGNTGFVALANVPDRAFKGPMGADAVDKAIDEAMQHEAG